MAVTMHKQKKKSMNDFAPGKNGFDERKEALQSATTTCEEMNSRYGQVSSENYRDGR